MIATENTTLLATCGCKSRSRFVELPPVPSTVTSASRDTSEVRACDALRRRQGACPGVRHVTESCSASLARGAWDLRVVAKRPETPRCERCSAARGICKCSGMDGAVLTGSRLRLVPVVRDEAEEWLAGEDLEQVRWFGPRASELGDVVRAVDEWQASWRDGGPVRHWGIRPLDSNVLMGGVEIRIVADGDRSVNLSYLVFPPYRRRGYAVEASRLALDYAKSELGATHALIRMAEQNDVSISVARRLGAIPVGTDTSDPERTFLVTRLDLSPHIA